MKTIALAFLASFSMALGAKAAPVTVLDTASLPTGGSLTLGNFSNDQDPLGQTFTLTQALSGIQIGGVIEDVNETFNPSLDIIISLYSGAGFGGPLLGSVSFTLADGFDGLTVQDFSFVGTLGVGIYTVGFSTGDTKRGALRLTMAGNGDPNSDPYNENGPFTIFGDPTRDFMVFVSGDDMSEIPIPAALPLFLAGLAGLGLARRKRRNAQK